MSASRQDVRVVPVTKSESLVLMKNMIRISISSICYMRDIFPKDCFKNKEYGSVDIHQLQAAVKDEKGEMVVHNADAFLLTQWLEKGVFAALEAEYLSSMTFAIFCKHPDTGEDLMCESYDFKVSFNSSEGHGKINDVSLISREVVKNQAAKFIRSLTEFSSTLDALPDNRWITLQLKYRDHTPAEYEPEYFTAAASGPFQGLDKMPLVINVGSVKTNSVDMRVKYAGLESFLFEDLRKANNRCATPTPVTPTSSPITSLSKPAMGGGETATRVSIFNAVAGGTATTASGGGGDQEDQSAALSKGLSKVHVDSTTTATSVPSDKVATLTDLAESAAARRELVEPKKEREEVVFKAVKQFILGKGVSTVKFCAAQLKMKEPEVRDAFRRLVQEGIIQQKKKGTNYSLSQNNNSNADATTASAPPVVATVTQPSLAVGTSSRPAVTVIPQISEEDDDDDKTVEESIENTPLSQQQLQQSSAVVAPIAPALGPYRKSTSPFARRGGGAAGTARPLVMQAPTPKLASAASDASDASAATSKGVVGGASDGVFQTPPCKGQKVVATPTAALTATPTGTNVAAESSKMSREAFELLSLSQSSEEGGSVNHSGGGKRARKCSVIKDPINLRALY